MNDENTSDIDAYVRLRTVLDGLEIGSLQYCLDDTHPEKRTQRTEELIEILTPIVEEIQARITGGVCGPGQYNCGGVCVPYKCPPGGTKAAKLAS